MRRNLKSHVTPYRLTWKLKFDWNSRLSSVMQERRTRMPISYTHATQIPSFLGILYTCPLTTKTDWRDACASHVTPSFLTESRIPIKLQLPGKSRLIVKFLLRMTQILPISKIILGVSHTLTFVTFSSKVSNLRDTFQRS